MSNILAQLYTASDRTQQQLDKIDNTLGAILQIETRESKEDAAERTAKKRDRRRTEQRAKRAAGDKKGLFGMMSKKDKEEEKKTNKGLLEGILGTLGGGILGILGSVAGFIGTKLLGAVTSIGGLLLGVIPKLFSLAGNLAMRMLKPLGNLAVQGIGKALKLFQPLLGLGKGALLTKAGLVGVMIGAPILIAAIAGKVHEHIKRQGYGGGKGGDLGMQVETRIRELRPNTRHGQGSRKLAPLSEEKLAEKSFLLEAQERIKDADKRRKERLKTAPKVSQGNGRNQRMVVTKDAKDEIQQDYEAELKEIAVEYGLQYQKGGRVPTMLEPGEKVFAPGAWNAQVEMMNKMFPRFQKGGPVDSTEVTGEGREKGGDTKGGPTNHQYLTMLNDENINKVGSPPGMCVTGSLDTMQASGVPNPPATGQDVGNNPRGGAAQLIKNFGWGAAYGSSLTLNSPYGSVPSKELSAEQYLSLVEQGAIPSGAMIFQTRHNSWNGTSAGSSGYDMAIAQQNGKALWNGQPLGSLVYSGTKKVMVLTPGGKPSKDNVSIDGSSNSSTESKSIFDIGGDALKMLGGAGGFVVGFAEGLFDAFGGLGGGIFGDLFSSVAGVAGGALGAAFGAGEGAAQAAGESLMPDGTPVPVTSGAKGLLDFIARYESGGSYTKIFGGDEVPDLTDKTIDEVVAIQKAHLRKGYESAAIGRYQMMYPEVYADKAGIPRSAKFSPENQDKMAMVYLEEDGYSRFKSGDMSADAFANNVAGTWAAMPTSSGRSAHAGVGSNASLVSREEFMKHVNAAKMQTGGIVSGRPSASIGRMKEAQEMFAEMIAEAAAVEPIVIYEEPPEAPTVTGAPSPIQEPPKLPNGPSTVQAADYFFNLSLGGSLA